MRSLNKWKHNILLINLKLWWLRFTRLHGQPSRNTPEYTRYSRSDFTTVDWT